MNTTISCPGCTNPAYENRPLCRQSLAWILHLSSDDATANDLLALQQWRSLSPAHERAWIEMLRMWRLLGIALRRYAARCPPQHRLVFIAKSSGASRPQRRSMH